MRKFSTKKPFSKHLLKTMALTAVFAILTTTVSNAQFLRLNAYLQDCNATISWTSTTEDGGNISYDVQRSYNMDIFTTISTINGRGSYQYYDFAIGQYTTTVYYRVVKNTRGGDPVISPIRAVKSYCDNPVQIGIGGDIAIAPNPVSVDRGEMDIKFEAAQAGTLSFTVVDMMGRVVKSVSVEAYTGFNSFNLDISDLPVGTYGLIDMNKYKLPKAVRFTVIK